MKSFWKTVLAVIVGIILVSIIGFMFSMAIFGSIAAIGSATAPMPRSGVLVMDMGKVVIGEQAQEVNPMQSLSGREMVETIGLWDAVQAINIAAEDPAVEYICLKTDGNASSLAATQEIRKSLEKFRESGKAVVSYIESPSTGSYYLASVADKVYMTAYPGATTMVTGVGSQMIFLKDLLDKFGVNMQLIRHGKFKSAGEMYTRNAASPENLMQYQVLVNSLWKSLSGEIAASRGISVEELDDAINSLKLCLPQDFVDCKLVDDLMTREQLEAKLASLSVKESFKDVSFIKFGDYVAAKVVPARKTGQIAVIYANGNIVDANDPANISGDRFAGIVRKVRDDDKIKAVVLRVNSPGGSVLASEKIKHELDLLGEKKPLIASYGDYAASGGYWISNNCDKIFTDAVTLTGSIGVFGLIPDLSKTLKDVAHVNVQAVTSNAHGDMYGLMRPFDQAEYKYMERSIEDIYERFTTIVSEGRGIPKEQVDEIGQGRVWTGADALGIRLVDEIGTLEDAITYAAVAAGDPDLSSWEVKGFPKPQTIMEQMMASLGKGEMDEEVIFLRKFGDLTKVQVLARLPFELELKY